MNYRPSTLNRFLSLLLVVSINILQLANPVLILAQEASSAAEIQNVDVLTPEPTTAPEENFQLPESVEAIGSAVGAVESVATASATPAPENTPQPIATQSAQITNTPQPVASQSANIEDIQRATDQEAGVSRDKFTPNEIIVKYKKDRVNIRGFFGQVKSSIFQNKHNLEKQDDIKNLNIEIHTTDEPVLSKIEELKKDPDVEYAEPNYIRYPRFTPNDAKFNKLWGLHNNGQDISLTSGFGFTGKVDADIDAPEAWDLESADQQDVIVAVLDSGVAYNHVDLKENMWNGLNCKDENNNFVYGGCPNYGWDFENNDNDPSDDYGHGTHVAGTIAALANNSAGTVGISSKNNIKIMALKIGFNNFTVANEIKAISFAKNNGAKVINASYGSGFPSQAEEDAIASFPGLFIAAAGNTTSDNDTFTDAPSGYDLPNIIAVAATDYSDQLAYFSSYGANSVDVGAPGVSIFSTLYDPSFLVEENFNSLTPPQIPQGYSKTGDFGTFNIHNNEIVLYGDIVNYPYKANANNTFTSPRIDLSKSAKASFDFYTRCDTQMLVAYTDYMVLEASGDGVNFSQIRKWDEIDLQSSYLQLSRQEAVSRGGRGYAGGYIAADVPSAYLTNNFVFRFRWITNGDSDTGTYGDGCYIDDLSFIDYTPDSDAYGFKDGTSMAAPHVVGEAAMIYSFNPNLSDAGVKNIILSSGDSLPALAGKTVSGKRINLYNALIQAGQQTQPSPTPSASPSATPTASPSASPAPLPTPTTTPNPTPTPTPTPTPVPNNPPVANDIAVTTSEDTAVTFDMSVTDPENNALSYEIVSQPAHGQLEVNVQANSLSGGGITSPTVIYTPGKDFNGTDEFTYKATDYGGFSNVAKAAITVKPVNDAPVAPNDSVQTQEDSSIDFILEVSDPDGTNPFYNIITNPQHGVLTTGENYLLTYTPNANYSGEDSFTYQANDGELYSGVAVITVIVKGVNDAPEAQALSLSTNEDTIVPVIFEEKDADGDTLVHSIISKPSHGQLVNPSNNSVKYVPDQDYFGDDSFTYKLNDGVLDSNTATVNIVVSPVNDAPKIIAVEVTPQNPKTDSILSVQVSADDVENNDISFKYQWKKNGVSLAGETQTSLDLSKEGNGNRNDEISVEIIASDGTVDSVALNSGSVTVENAAPVTGNDTLLTSQNINLVFKAANLTKNDSDLDPEDKLEVTAITALTHGDASLSDGNITFIPEDGYTGQANLLYSVTDGSKVSVGSAVVHILEPQDEGKTLIAPVVNIEPANPVIVVGNTSVDSIINVSSDVKDALLDTSTILTVIGETKQANITSNIVVNSDSAVGMLNITIPAGITISGPADWDGNIILPASVALSGIPLPSQSGKSNQATAAIEVGAGDTSLTFSKAVRLVIPGKAGQLAGFVRGPVFTAITNTCTADTQSAADVLASGTECRIDSGSDLVIWTKHFTKFVTYNQTNNAGAPAGGAISSNSSSNASSTGAPTCNDAKPGSAPILLSAQAGENSVTLTWSQASDPVTYYLVAYGLESGKVQFGNPNVGDKNTLSYTVRNLSGGVTYYFKVRAGNNCMSGDFSNELPATPTGSTTIGEATGFEEGILAADMQEKDDLEASRQATGQAQAIVNTVKNNPVWIILALILLGIGVFIYKSRFSARK
ncbi:tandem-95 repeat protein [Candidatus Daviesbacteria bacterium]|nr:tandem-95 repeat protein [Candidatus Daviesbacteria bacterium]